MMNDYWTIQFKNRFKLIQPGMFLMGTPPWQVKELKNRGLKLFTGEKNCRLVRITRPFYVDRFPTTVADFDRFASAYDYDRLCARGKRAAEGNRQDDDSKVWTWERNVNVCTQTDLWEGDGEYIRPLADQNAEKKYGWSKLGRNWHDFYWDFEYYDKSVKDRDLLIQARYIQGLDNPVVGLNRKEVYAYLCWLNANAQNNDLVKERYQRCFGFIPTFRLLTEAESEYCARAGSLTIFPWGDKEEDAAHYANVADRSSEQDRVKYPRFEQSFRVFDNLLGNMFRNDRSFMTTGPVGSYKPNKFGLYDMIGNVLEMTSDAYDENQCGGPKYDGTPIDDPGHMSKDEANELYAREDDEYFDSLFVCKGGAWCGGPDVCRPAARVPRSGWYRSDYLGFRVCFDVPEDFKQ